jgi:DNA polymerase elongation subunit (family B)
LEKIVPEEAVVDDNTRQVHTVIAGASGGGDIEDIEDVNRALNDAGVETGNLDFNLNLGADGSDDNEIADNNDNEKDDNGDERGDEKDDERGDERGDCDEKGKSKVKFTLKSNFNQIIMNEESYEGAIVLNPKTDIYTEDPITVLDFSSLYPSEMISSDLSHDRICEDPYWLGETGAKHLADLGLSYLDRTYDNFMWINSKIKSQGKRKCGTTTVRFVQYPDGQKGLIPRVLQGLLKSRKDTKKKMEAEPDPYKKALYDGLQLAYKVTANSIYGQIGARTSKVFKPQIAASTTAGGRARILHARDFVLREYPGSAVIYGDTDSIFVAFVLAKKNEQLSDREKISRAIAIGQEVEQRIKSELPKYHSLAYEKVLFPFILISKKRYLALKYEDSPDSYKQLSSGLVLKRRDNAPILKHCYLGVIDHIVKNKNIVKAIKFVKDEIKKMIDEKFDMNMFVISKTLASFYKDEDSIAHKVLANRMVDRGDNAPSSNERIPYIFIKIKEEPSVDYLNGDRIEHVDYVRKNNLQIDYEKYIESQLVKPISQIFELIVEKIPMFPYGKGYYDELFNIWYNKYNGDIEKTEKKIKQLKSLMVKKLIFQPLIDYANSKVNKVTTIDNWFKPKEVIDTEVKDKINKDIKVEKPKHEIKVKKNKQLSLDSFF